MPSGILGMLVAVAVALVGAALLALVLSVLLVPLVASLFVVYLLQPGIEILERRGLDRGRAYLLLFGGATVLLVVLVSFAPSWLRIESFEGSAETFSTRLDAQLDAVENRLVARFPMFGGIRDGDLLSSRLSGFAEEFALALPGILSSFVLNLILVPFVAFFMVRDGRKLRRRIVSLVPNRYFEMSLVMFHRIDEQIGGYLRGRLIECFLVALTQVLLMGVAAVFVPQPQILLISAVCGVTNLIPYAGPLIGGAFGVFLYFSGGYPMESIWALILVIAAAHLVDNIVIAPAVLSHNVDLHPLTVALVLIIGGEVLGVLGLLIAIPVASSIKVIAQEVHANYRAHHA